MTNTHIHVPEAPYWDRDIYGSAMHNGVPVFSKLGRGPRGFAGEQGQAGTAGRDGEDGLSPKVYCENIDGTDYLVVEDREGTTRYPLDVSAGNPSAVADAFTVSDLWPKWYHYCPTSKNVRNKYTQSSNNITVERFYCESWVRYAGGQPHTMADDIANVWSAQLGSGKIIDARFTRNGLDYSYVKGSIIPVADEFLFTFYVRTDNNRPMLQFTPALGSGHNLEDCTLSVLIAPAVEDVILLPMDEEE